MSEKIVLLCLMAFVFVSSYAQTEVADTTVSYEQTLDNVDVIAPYLQHRRNGDIIMRIAGNPLAAGKSISQFLNFIPGVVSRNNIISVNGMPDTEFYIGNRKSSIEELKMINLSQIQQIEVIKDPNMSYGNVKGGIIKIILKKQHGVIGGLDLKNQEDKDGYVDASITNFTMYQKGKNSIYNGIYYGYGRYHSKTIRKDETESSVTETMMKTKNRDYALRDNVGFIHEFNSSSNITVYGGFAYGDSHKLNTSECNGTDLKIKDNGDNYNYNLGTVYSWIFKKNEKIRKLILKAEYTHTSVNSNDIYSYAQNDKDEGNRYYYSVNFDPRYTFSISKKSVVSMGLLLSYLKDKNDQTGMEDNSLSQVLRRQYTIEGSDFQPWAEIQGNIGHMFYHVGLRYVDGTLHYYDRLDANNDYKNDNQDGWFPNAAINWRISNNKILRLSYRHYYSYPNYGYYNPVAVYSSENFYSIGNQHLKMETFDRIELEYRINNSLSFYYQLKAGDNIIQITTNKYADSNVYFTMPENVGRNMRHQFSIYANYKIFKIWHTNNSINFIANHERIKDATENCMALSFNSTNQIDLGNKAGINIDIELNSKSKTVNYQYSGRYLIDLGGYYQFNKNLHLNIMLGNIIHNHDKMTILGNGYKLIRQDKTNLSRLKINLVWNFSSGKIKKVNTRRVENFELKHAEF